MGDTVTIKFKCPDCGSTIVWDEGASDADLSRCSGCGQEGPPVGDLKKRAMAETKARAEKMLRDSFKGVKGWKPN